MLNLRNFFKKSKLPVLYMNGVIDDHKIYEVQKGLSRINPAKILALSVVVDSPGGSPVQCHHFKNEIRQFCDQNKLKLYTFTENQAVGGGYYVLSAGDEVYAQTGSLVGNIRASTKGLFLKEQYGLKTETLTTNPDLWRENIDTFADQGKKSQEKLTQLLKEDAAKIWEDIQIHRGSKLKNDPEIKEGKIYLGQDAVEAGLVDGIGNYQTVLMEKYPDEKIEFIRTTYELEQILKILKVASQIGLGGFIVIFLLFKVASYTLKLVILKYALQGGDSKKQ